MSEPLEDFEEACPRCRRAVPASAEVCSFCRSRLTVDVFVLSPVPDGRQRYLVARSLVALGPPILELREVQAALQTSGGVVARGATRLFAARSLEALSAQGVEGAVREGRFLDRVLPRGIQRGLRAHPLMAGGGAMALVTGLLAGFLWTREPPDLTPVEIGRRSLPGTAVVRCGESVGSGFFVGKERLLTNAHVVCEGDIHVVVAGANLSAQVVKRDDDIDLALLKVPGAMAPRLPLGDATALRVGEPVVILGSPQGLGDSLQRGTVSHVGRALMGTVYVQVDANVNPGNSGGPLIDRKGRVVGVVSMANAGGRGIGFALPINYATRGAAFVRGPSERDWLGLTRPGALLFQEWVSGAEREDAKEAETVRSSLSRPTLVAAVPGPVEGRIGGRPTVAVVIQRSGWQPGSMARRFRVSRNGLLVWEGRVWVERWVHPDAQGGAEPAYFRWLRRHDLAEGLYVGTAIVGGSECRFDAVAGGEMAMEGDGGEVDRVSIQGEEGS